MSFTDKGRNLHGGAIRTRAMVAHAFCAIAESEANAGEMTMALETVGTRSSDHRASSRFGQCRPGAARVQPGTGAARRENRKPGTSLSRSRIERQQISIYIPVSIHSLESRNVL